MAAGILCEDLRCGDLSLPLLAVKTDFCEGVPVSEQPRRAVMRRLPGLLGMAANLVLVLVALDVLPFGIRAVAALVVMSNIAGFAWSAWPMGVIWERLRPRRGERAYAVLSRGHVGAVAVLFRGCGSSASRVFAGRRRVSVRRVTTGAAPRQSGPTVPGCRVPPNERAAIQKGSFCCTQAHSVTRKVASTMGELRQRGTSEAEGRPPRAPFFRLTVTMTVRRLPTRNTRQ